MSEIPAAAAKPRFYVINRGSGSEGSDEEAQVLAKPTTGLLRIRNLPNPPRLPPAQAPSISTNINIRGPRYQPSYQSLSSPSPTTTSSPGANDESTPPPVTPGLTLPPADFIPDVSQAQELLTDAYSANRDLPTSRAGKFMQSLKSPFHKSPAYHRPPSAPSPKRPSIVRTLFLIIHGFFTSLQSPTDPADRILILVTADSERYVNVDITGAKNPGFIRECVFTKVRALSGLSVHAFTNSSLVEHF